MAKADKLKVNYVYDKTYSPDLISGVHSTVSPKTELELNFYLERSALPKMEVFDFNEDGTINESVPSEVSPLDFHEKLCIVRHIKSGIILNYEGAKELKELLEKYLKLIDDNKEEEKEV